MEENNEQAAQVMFNIGDYVVYPLQGVGKIVDIRQRVFQGREINAYTIYVPISDMNVMIPVDKAASVGIRAIVDGEQALCAIAALKDKYEPSTLDWKQRYQANVELVKQGSIMNIAKVVQGLHFRSKVKELPVQERKLYENATRLLIDEAAIALSLEPNQVKKMVEENLER